MEDALVVAMFLMSFIRHADCVKVANLAQLVNVIGPLLTQGDQLLKQSIFHAFAMFSRRKQGVALRCAVAGPSYSSKRYGEVCYLDAAAILAGAKLHLFAINRSVDQPMELELDFAGVDVGRVLDAEILCADLKAENTFEAPGAVSTAPFDGWRERSSRPTAVLPAHALIATTFALRE